MGYLYVIRSKKSSDFYKIGITANWSNRSKQLYVNKKTTLYLLFLFSDNAEKMAEKTLHNYFKNDRLPQSEWFYINDYVQLSKVCNAIAVKQFGASVAFVESKKDDHHKAPKSVVFKENVLCDLGDCSESELRAIEADDWAGEGEETFIMHSVENPFLHNFEIEQFIDGGPNIYIQYIQPDNVLAEVAFSFEFCDKKNCLQLVFLGSYVVDYFIDHDLYGKEDWFMRHWPNFDQNTVNCQKHYLLEFYRLFLPLTQIPEIEWPYRVRQKVFEQESRMRTYLTSGTL